MEVKYFIRHKIYDSLYDSYSFEVNFFKVTEEVAMESIDMEDLWTKGLPVPEFIPHVKDVEMEATLSVAYTKWGIFVSMKVGTEDHLKVVLLHILTAVEYILQ